VAALKYSIVIPVYKNEVFIGKLVDNLEGVACQLNGELEVIFVVDSSPDRSYELLQQRLPAASFHSQLLLLTRNFGSFPAVTAGILASKGDYVAVIAADLQEPPELTLRFFAELENGDCDIVFGQRESRADPWQSKLAARVFWGFYRRFVQRDMPSGGVDVFACNRAVCDVLMTLQESNTSLVGLLMWVGFRRRFVGYKRLLRESGKSAWTIRRKIRYLKDSIFAFSDLPLRLLGYVGMLGMCASAAVGVLTVAAKLAAGIDVPGYAATVSIVVFFGGLNSFGISLLGEYLWRTFENSKSRPRYILLQRNVFSPSSQVNESQRE